MQVVKDDKPTPSPYAHARLRYVAKGTGAELYVFNLTDGEPDLVIQVAGVEYVQDVKFVDDTDYKPQAGDYIMRYLDAVELADLSRRFAKAWWKENHRGSKVGFKAIIKQYKDKLRRKPVVFQLSEKAG